MKRSERGLGCTPIMWIGQGAALVPHDEQHAFRWEVRDERGTELGFINADRALSHPKVMWKRVSVECKDLDGKYKTVEEAFAAF